MQVYDKNLNDNKTRESQLKSLFKFDSVDKKCKEEFLKIPIDLPWKELEKDIELAFEKFGWYGMCHRANSDWNRSEIYGGLGLTYNPTYKFNMSYHAHTYGQPRSSKNAEDSKVWLESLDRKNYSEFENTPLIRGKDTYDDCLGFRNPTDVTKFRSFKHIFEKLNFTPIQGRIAQIKAADYGDHPNKDFIWHRDEKPDTVTRMLIPLVYSDDYYIEFKDTGTRFYFEPGYAYHWNTYDQIHRWSFDYHKNIINRTCIVLGFTPWLDYDNGIWTTNKYFNKMHPTDMVNQRLVM
jgi:hypothetical protein